MARDALKEREGKFEVTALGFIPIVCAEHSSALMRGELMRYLAEPAWAPDAILRNTTLHWRVDGPDKLAVSAGSGDAAAEVVLSLDSKVEPLGVLPPIGRGRPQYHFCRHPGVAGSPTIAGTTICRFHLRAKSPG